MQTQWIDGLSVLVESKTIVSLAPFGNLVHFLKLHKNVTFRIAWMFFLSYNSFFGPSDLFLFFIF